MRLLDLAAYLSGELIGGDAHFGGVSTDTRTIKAGDLYIALKGHNFDGHAFIPSAVERGACAVVAEQMPSECSVPVILVNDCMVALGRTGTFIRQQFSGQLIAITGSCGKTSVKGMLKSICEQAGNTLATIGNLNNHIGVPLTLARLQSTHQFAVIEMGASALGEIHYLAAMAQPTISLVNNVRAAHVGGFGGIDNIAQEKGAIYDALDESGVAIVNADEPFAENFKKRIAARKIIEFGCRSGTSVFINAEAIQRNSHQCFRFELHIGSEMAPIELQVLGEHYVANALAAAACAHAAGIPISDIQVGLQAYVGESGRMQLIHNFYESQTAQIINDAYNANPGSVRAAIDYLAGIQGAKKVLVLGDMGELGPGEIFEHTSIGLYARECGLDQLICVGELARHAAEAFGPGAKTFTQHAEAAKYLTPMLAKKAALLIKGSRSSKMEQVIEQLKMNVSLETQGARPC